MSRILSVASALGLRTGRRALPVDYLDQYPPALRHGAPIVDGWWRWRDHDVHLARLPAPEAPVVAILLHGAGGHAGLLAPYGRLVDGQAEVVVPDLPGYGLTRVRGPVDYAGWIACVADLVRAQDRPVALLGASMGGLLAYDVAAALSTGPGPAVRAVAATCLADPGDREVRRAVTPWPALGERAPALLRLLRPADPLRVPIRWISRMSDVSADPRLVDAVRRDPLGGGNRVGLRFLRTWLTSRRPVEPERFDACPVILLHPAADTWTPPELSLRFLARVAGPTETVMLENASHLPTEQPGLDQLHAAVHRLLNSLESPPGPCAKSGVMAPLSAHVRGALMGEVPGPGEVHRDARLLGHVDRQLVAH